jgi:hypothetical protein
MSIALYKGDNRLHISLLLQLEIAADQVVQMLHFGSNSPH